MNVKWLVARSWKRAWIRLLIRRWQQILWARGNEAWSEIILKVMDELCFRMNGLEPDTIPLNSFIRLCGKNCGRESVIWDRSSEDCLILIWPCIVFHGPLYTWRWGMCGSENGVSHMPWLPHLVKLFTQILSVYYTISYPGF